MLYLIYGQQSVMISNRLKKIVAERLEFKDELNYITYDLDNASLFDALNDACYLPLGYDHKIVVIKNCYFLKKSTGRVNKKNLNSDVSLLFKYIKNDDLSTDLILIYNDTDIDTNSDIYNLIATKGKVFQLINIDKKDWNTYIYKYFNQSLHIQIDRDAIEELSNRVKGDLNIFLNEANKLSLYTDHVTYDDVCKLVNKPLEDNLYDLFNLLMSNKNSEALKLADDLFFNNEEPVRLISMLANQFRLLLNIIYLSNAGLSNSDIATTLGIRNEIRVKILKKYLFTLSLNQLMDVLDELYQLDFKIKSGQIDRFVAFKMFITNFKTK